MTTEPKEIKVTLIETDSSKELLTSSYKEGLFILKDTCLASRYNFLVDCYNQPEVGDTVLTKLPLNKHVSRILDLNTMFIRWLFIFLLLFKTTFFSHHNSKFYGKRSQIDTSKKRENRSIVCLFSIFAFTLGYFLPKLSLTVLSISASIRLTESLSVFILFYLNNKKINGEYFKKAIFDSELDNSSSMNDYIVASEGNLEDFQGYKYFKHLEGLVSPTPATFLLYSTQMRREYSTLTSSHLLSSMALASFCVITNLL